MKYAKATWWIFLSWLARKAHLPRRLVEEWEDEASMRMLACTLDFEPVRVVTKPDSGPDA